MSVIYKYPIELNAFFELGLPEGANVLAVQLQRGHPCMWVAHDISRAKVQRRFQIIGTGHHFDIAHLEYIGTFQQDEFVWHLFEEVL